MKSESHIIIGVSTSLALTYAYALSPSATLTPFFPLVIAGAFVGSLFPDIDHPNSRISRAIPAGWLVSKLFSHRGFFHSVIGAIVVLMVSAFALSFIGSAIVVYLGGDYDWMIFASSSLFTGFAYAYMLHIVADMLTMRGVRLLYPMQANIGVGIVTTGTWQETVIAYGVGAFWVYQMVMWSL